MMEEILKLTCSLLYSQMSFLFMEFGASLQFVLQSFMQLHYVKKRDMARAGRKEKEKKKKGKGGGEDIDFI